MKRAYLLVVILCRLQLTTLCQEVDSATYYTKIAQSFSFKNNDSVKFYAEKAKDYSQKEEDFKGLVAYYNILGVNVEEQGEFDEALLYFDSAFVIASTHNDSVNLSRIYHHIGVAYREKSEFESAIENLQNAYLIAEKFNMGDLMSSAPMNISIVYQRMSKLTDAKKYAQYAYINSKKDTSAERFQAGILIEYGNIFYYLNQIDSCIWAYKEALLAATKAGQNNGRTVAINNLGFIFYILGEYENAIDYFKQSIELASLSNDQVNIALGLMNVGDTYTSLKQYKLAEDYLKQGLDIFTKIRHLHYIRDAYENFVKLEKAKGNLNAALDYTNLMYAYKDSILNERNTARIAELQTQYETEKKDNEIKTLKTESELKELQIAQTQTLVITISVIAVLVLILIIFYNRQRRLKLLAQMAQEKEQLQKDRFRVVIDTEEKERMRVARELHDGLGQMLSTVRLFVSDMADTDENPKVERSLKALDSTIDEVRNISHNMMPIKLMELGLPAALEDIAKRVNESSKLNMVIENAALLSFGETESIALYRTIQEVVNNAIKYAKANVIKVQIVEANDSLSIIIKDDGQGFNTENIAKSKGIGWSNIYARMELIGADVKVISKSAEGTQVILNLPRKSTEIRSAKAS